MTRTIVVGAGMTGLSTAWHLQEYGHEVEVLERIDVADARDDLLIEQRRSDGALGTAI